MLDTITMSKRLNGEYKTAFEEVEIYGLAEGGAVENYDEKMMEIFDILLEAQNENKPIEKIVGKDLELFCKNFFEEKVIEENKSIKILYSAMKLIFIWAILEIINRDEGIDILSTKSDITLFFMAILTSFVVEILTRKVFRKLALRNKKITPGFFSFCVVIFDFSMYLISINIVRNIFVIKTFWFLLISSIYIIIYVIFRAIWRYKKHGKITKIKKENDFEEFNKELKKYNDIDFKIRMAQALAKKFKRWNKLNKKRGKPELTVEQLCEKNTQEYKSSIIYWIIIYSLLVIIPSVMIAKANGLNEGLCFGAILGVLEGFLCWATIAGAKESKKILNECEEQGIDIDEYVERLKKK